MVPGWFHGLSIVSLGAGVVVAAAIAIDEASHPQPMWIMNLVWPLVALSGSVFAGLFYLGYGRSTVKRKAPFAIDVAKGACHCGSGCTLGDILAETLMIVFPTVALWFGWKSVFSERMFAAWVVDFIAAFGFGILFQYYTIAPMRQLSPAAGLWAALKADTFSLTAWQIGMYGLMALAQFAVFRRLWATPLEPVNVEFWFVMQLAMMAGFATSYPVNWWLLHRGLKERM